MLRRLEPRSCRGAWSREAFWEPGPLSCPKSVEAGCEELGAVENQLRVRLSKHGISKEELRCKKEIVAETTRSCWTVGWDR